MAVLGERHSPTGRLRRCEAAVAGRRLICIATLCKTLSMDLPAVASPDDALWQPTRARLFTLLGELKRPAGTAELAERLDLHPNGVRLHLERLQEAGLVERARVRHRRGRPPDAWTIARDAEPGGEAPHAYQDLGRWLARALRSLTALGFRPTIQKREGDRLTFCLRSCPYRDAVRENQTDEAGCLIELRGLSEPAGDR